MVNLFVAYGGLGNGLGLDRVEVVRILEER